MPWLGSFGWLSNARSEDVPWYLSGGVAAANCLAAYKAIGAASLAASYINLANPGTYDCTTPSAPSFNAATGWTFNGTTNVLNTGITPANGAVQTWSLIVRFSGATSDGNGLGVLLGSYNGAGSAFFIAPRHIGADYHDYVNGAWGGNWALVAGRITSGILALAGGNCYKDGATDGTFAPASIGSDTIYIGGTVFDHYLGAVQACAIYNASISTQIAALTIAMAALA